MQDRVPTPGQEGRVLITPEDGSEPFYARIQMADNPTSDGTPLNKETLLQDATETALFGSANNRTVDQAFRGIADKIDLIMGDQAAMTLTVQDSNGTGIPGVLISNLLSEDGDAVYTNPSGVASGYVAEGNITLSINGYADIVDYSESMAIIKGESYTKTWVVTTRNFLKLTSSTSKKFSENVDRVDVSVLAAGGAGGSPPKNMDVFSVGAGGGGGGGHVTTQENVDFTPNTNYPAIIGAGGIPTLGEDGSAGGSSSFLGVQSIGGEGGEAPIGESSSSSAANGGIGNGNGGRGQRVNRNDDVVAAATAGTDGTETFFISFTESAPFGGGGSGPYAGDDSAGAPYGGQYKVNSGNASNNTGGGGSGGRYNWLNTYAAGILGGKGGSGAVSMRMHLKSTSSGA